MKSLREVALIEYKAGISITEGSYLINIPLWAFLVLFCLLLMGIYKPFKKKTEIRHFGFLLTNIVYMIFVFLGLQNKGFLFTLGSISCELYNFITKSKETNTYLFIFSAFFIYTFYIMLLAFSAFYKSLATSIFLASLACGTYKSLYEIYIIAQTLAQAVSISVALSGLYMLLTYKSPSFIYIEKVSLFLIGSIFFVLTWKNIRNKYIKLH